MSQFILYVLLTVTPPINGHCGVEVTALSYKPARIQLSDLQTDDFGTLRTRRSIQFPVAKENWGTISGFCLADSNGEVIDGGALVGDVHIEPGESFKLDINIGSNRADRLMRRLTNRWFK